MTREVLIRISGLQMMEDDNEPQDVEVITRGEYFLRNGRHFVIYEEAMEDFGGSVRNTLRITPEMLSVHKQGIAATHMVFEQEKKNIAHYATPMGDMVVEICTNDVLVEEQEDHLKVVVDYSLDINYEHVSDCKLRVEVCSLEKAELHLADA